MICYASVCSKMLWAAGSNSERALAKINVLETSPQVFPSRCSGCFCCVPVTGQWKERDRARKRERDASEVRRNALLAYRKRTKLSWLLGPGTVERNGVSAVRTRGARLPLGWCGVFVSCQHAQLGAELTSLTRKSQAAEELCEAADFSFLYFLTDCQQVQCAVPQAFPERSQRRAPNER